MFAGIVFTSSLDTSHQTTLFIHAPFQLPVEDTDLAANSLALRIYPRYVPSEHKALSRMNIVLKLVQHHVLAGSSYQVIIYTTFFSHRQINNEWEIRLE